MVKMVSTYSIFLSTFVNKHRGSTGAYKIFFENQRLEEDVVVMPSVKKAVQSTIVTATEALKCVVSDIEERKLTNNMVHVRIVFRRHQFAMYTNNTTSSLNSIISQYTKHSVGRPSRDLEDVETAAIRDMKQTRQSYLPEKAFMVRVLHHLTMNGIDVHCVVVDEEPTHPVFGSLFTAIKRKWDEKPKREVASKEIADYSAFI